jgi:hypothetical protein
MRAFLAFAIVFCALTGLWLLWAAPAFYLPDRGDTGCGWWIDPTGARLVGLALLGIAVAGWRLVRIAARGTIPDARWQRRHALLTLGAFALFVWVSARAPYVTDPDQGSPVACSRGKQGR